MVKRCEDTRRIFNDDGTINTDPPPPLPSITDVLPPRWVFIIWGIVMILIMLGRLI